MEFIASEALGEVLHLETNRCVVVLDDAAKFDGLQRGIPRCPEGEPSNFIQEVAGDRTAPVEDGLEPGGIRSDEDVAVEEVPMQKVADLRARPEQRAQSPFSGNEDIFNIRRFRQPGSPSAYPLTRMVL